MALYAFDGTWNDDEDLDSQDTNVVRFQELYTGTEVEYVAGVGTRFGSFGKTLGGLFGAGGRSRIREMYEDLLENWKGGDKEIDIIGFSRGAALAVHFANRIAKKGVVEADGSTVIPRIRFLGVWDVVGSFGLSFDTFVNFQDINLGWNFDEVARNVDHCAHAMALDERRETFNVTRLDPEGKRDNVEEVWFRGVHSDIGGGNGNTARSNIALRWMLERAQAAGVPIDQTRAAEEKYSAVDTFAPVSQNKDPRRDPRREVLAGDKIHESALLGTLKPGEARTCIVDSGVKYNWSGVRLVAGASYRIETPGEQRWQDGEMQCEADGWSTDELSGFKKTLIRHFEGRRRHPEAQWFELVGALGDDDDELVRIGKSCDLEAARDADLYLFANDLGSKYGNNKGAIEVAITRVA